MEPQTKRRQSILRYLRRNILWEGFDSWWWDASRGRPPTVVVFGVWLFSPPFVLVTFFFTSLFVGVILYRPFLWLGFVRQDFTFHPTDNILVAVSYLCGFFSSWIAVRPLISTTVLYFILDDEEEVEESDNASNKIEGHLESGHGWQSRTTDEQEI